MDEELRQLDVTIFEHLQRRRGLVRQIQDAFTPLSEDAPHFRAIFAGVELPIKNRDEWIEKLGGPNRLISTSDPRYGEMTFALLDFLDTVENPESYLPIQNWEVFVKEVQNRRETAKAKQGKPPFRGWGRIPTKHLQRILKEAKAPPTRPVPRPQLRPRAMLVSPCINTELLTKLAQELKAKAKKVTKGGGGNPGYDESIASVLVAIVAFLEQWSQSVLRNCQNTAEARLIDATNGRQEAQSQAGIAQDRRNQALAATTIANLCNLASQARTAATAADTAAANAEDAAVLARNAASSCPDNAQAANAATQAEQQATQARSAATNADIAADQAEALCTTCSSIQTATICVHVQDDDKYEDDVDGANVTIRNLDYSSCPGVTVGNVTGGNGRCCVTGPFKNSQVIVMISYGSYNMSRQFYMATDSRSEYFKIPGLDV